MNSTEFKHNDSFATCRDEEMTSMTAPQQIEDNEEDMKDSIHGELKNLV